MTKFSRRQFVLTAGAATASSLLVHGCSSGSNTDTTASSPAPAVNVNSADAPETNTAILGFIALTDCALLVIAITNYSGSQMNKPQ